MIRLDGRQQALPRRHGRGRSELDLDVAARRAGRPRRPVRLRQDHHDADGQPADRADVRPDPARRRGRHRAPTRSSCAAASATSSSRSGCSRTRRSGSNVATVPAAARLGPRAHAASGPTSCSSWSGSTRRAYARPLPARALRRPAAAGRRGPGARRRPAGAADGRAVRRRRPDRRATGCRTSSCGSRPSSARPSLFVTHDIDEAVRLGDRIAVLSVGGVLEQSPTRRPCSARRPPPSSPTSSAPTAGCGGWRSRRSSPATWSTRRPCACDDPGARPAVLDVAPEPYAVVVRRRRAACGAGSAPERPRARARWPTASAGSRRPWTSATRCARRSPRSCSTTPAGCRSVDGDRYLGVLTPGRSTPRCAARPRAPPATEPFHCQPAAPPRPRCSARAARRAPDTGRGRASPPVRAGSGGAPSDGGGVVVVVHRHPAPALDQPADDPHRDGGEQADQSAHQQRRARLDVHRGQHGERLAAYHPAEQRAGVLRRLGQDDGAGRAQRVERRGRGGRGSTAAPASRTPGRRPRAAPSRRAPSTAASAARARAGSTSRSGASRQRRPHRAPSSSGAGAGGPHHSGPSAAGRTPSRSAAAASSSRPRSTARPAAAAAPPARPAARARARTRARAPAGAAGSARPRR